ncbi:MAG: hypothetical protein ACJ8EB_08315, partial [Allosphingosinicella sp.]
MSAVASPRWFPHYYEAAADLVAFVERDEASYRAASFLDDSSLPPAAPRHPAPWSQVAALVPADARRDAQYIFHIGHVGSTLVSRLLGELPEVLALREPVILRDFAACIAGATWDPASIPVRIDTLTALLSRTFRSGQRAMVKASSPVSEIAAELVPPGSRALLLYARPERYIANILAGENSRVRHREEAEARLRRLHRRTGEARWNAATMGEGAVIASAWACEMGSLLAAADRLGEGRIHWLDFDAFLAGPAAGLGRLAGFFGLDPAAARDLAEHPLMGRYAKALDHPFTPAAREALLAQARSEHAAALAEGMAWLGAAADAAPHVARCLDAAAIAL